MSTSFREANFPGGERGGKVSSSGTAVLIAVGEDAARPAAAVWDWGRGSVLLRGVSGIAVRGPIVLSIVSR